MLRIFIRIGIGLGMLKVGICQGREPTSNAKTQEVQPSAAVAAPPLDLAGNCEKTLKTFPGSSDAKALKSACQKVQLLPTCKSVQGVPIFHYEKLGETTPTTQRILVFSMIHGDETPAGSVGRYWMERLETIAPRNQWRVIPLLNPDGYKLGTRTNFNKVDVNRNFPTLDWETKAQSHWKSTTKSNPRRFPGSVAGSEPETQCALNHIKDFHPDFVVSIHTPLKVLDFDGPKLKSPPRFDYLPWRSLGQFPGSLGKYLWSERKIPVLTMELKEDLPQNHKPFEKLQDIIGYLVQLESQNFKTPRPSEPPAQNPHSPTITKLSTHNEVYEDK